VAGLPLGRFFPDMPNALLVCVTEQHPRADVDRLVEALAR
jgi:glycine dehydrogenase subunit 1